MIIELSEKDLEVIELLFQVWDKEHLTFATTSYNDIANLAKRFGHKLPGLEDMLARYAKMRP
jgi:hypothetical protein